MIIAQLQLWPPRVRRAAVLAWRIARWGVIGALVPALALIQVAIVAVVAMPLPDDLFAQGGGSLVIVDRHGEAIATVSAGAPDRDHWVALADVPAVAVSAVIESEDHGFWDHRGVDARGVARAAWLDARGGELRFGGSTLTMQLARMVRGTTADRTLANKARETLLALRIERALTKRQILEQWLNRAYFGNGAYGIDAAARLYFGKPAAALATGEVVLLAVIPRAPTAYDPLRQLDAALARRDRVLELLVRRGVLARGEADTARLAPVVVSRHAPATAAPHFVRWVVDQLPPARRAAGGVVRTSLDLGLQRLLDRRLREHVDGLAGRNLDQAGLVVLDARTSEVIALVGSAGWDTQAGQLDITTRRRHPGSALKPFVYAAAIEAGDSPASIAFDVAEATPGYFVTGRPAERGPVRYREALAGSYNFAAVWTLQRAGIERVMTALRQAGVATLSGAPDEYGDRLALGAPKVRLIDLAAGYGFLVRGGTVRPATGIVVHDGEDGSRWRPPPGHDRRVFSPATSWLVMDMLADTEARRVGFGHELPFDLPFRVAAKTGTSRGFSDTVAVAATREVIVAAWAGNFDGTPTHGVVAMQGAAPLVRAALLAVARGRALTLPGQPDDVDDITVCAVSGMKPGPDCPRKHDHAAHRARHHPGAAPVCDWHRRHGDRTEIVWPPEVQAWLGRQRRRMPQAAGSPISPGAPAAPSAPPPARDRSPPGTP
jgi:penicillin-binding protein 1C